MVNSQCLFYCIFFAGLKICVVVDLLGTKILIEPIKKKTTPAQYIRSTLLYLFENVLFKVVYDIRSFDCLGKRFRSTIYALIRSFRRDRKVYMYL